MSSNTERFFSSTFRCINNMLLVLLAKRGKRKREADKRLFIALVKTGTDLFFLTMNRYKNIIFQPL